MASMGLLACLVVAIIVGGAVYVVLWPRAVGRTGGQRSLRDLLSLSEAEPLDLASRADATPTLSRLLARMAVGRQMQLSIVRAGWALRPAEFVVLSVFCGALGWVVGFAIGRNIDAGALEVIAWRLIMGAGLALGVGAVPWVVMTGRQLARQQALMRQMPDTVDLMVASLRSGYGYTQVLRAVSERMPAPMGVEAARVVDELTLGLSLHETLDRMIVRANQQDVTLLCTAMQVQARTGGNLSEVLMSIGDVVRERIRLAGEVSALAAEGRMSAGVLVVLPVVMAVVLSYMRPGWLSPLFTDPVGQLILVGGALAFVIGIYSLNKLTQIDL